MTTGNLDTTKYNNMVSNAAANVKISSTVFKDFIADIQDKNNSNYAEAYADYIASIGLYRQALINGNFNVWQRGTSWTNPSNGQFTPDHYFLTNNADGGTLPNVTHSQLTLTPGNLQGSYYGYRINVNGAGSGFGVNASYLLNQKIEFGTRFLCGSGKKVTVSFWAKSDIAGKRIGVDIVQRYGSGGSPSANEQLVGAIFTLTSTWTKYSFTFTTNTLVGKTFGTNNDDALQLQFAYLWGTAIASSLFGGGTAETFVGAGNIDIAQLQLNAGDTALPFQPRSFAEELALCQRYYEKSKNVADDPTSISYRGESVMYNLGQTLHAKVNFKVQKRITSPTVSVYQIGRTTPNSVLVQSSGLAVTVPTATQYEFTLNSSTVIGSSGNDFAQFDWECDAEL